MRAIILVLCMLVSPLQAQECSTWQAIQHRLKTDFQEIPFSRAIATRRGTDTILMLFANRESGTWTIVQVTPPNCAIVLDHGYGMELLWSKTLPGESS